MPADTMKMPEPIVVPATIESESKRDKRGLRVEFDTIFSEIELLDRFTRLTELKQPETTDQRRHCLSSRSSICRGSRGTRRRDTSRAMHCCWPTRGRIHSTRRDLRSVPTSPSSRSTHRKADDS